MKNTLTLALFALISVHAQASGFLERFALADDRTAALAELPPGSDDAFYYRALHHLNQGEFDQFKGTMEDWQNARKRDWPNQRARELLNRGAILRYTVDQQGSLEYLRNKLNLHFNHTRRDGDRRDDLPTEFDNRRIETGMLLRNALRSRTGNRDLREIEPEGNFLLEELELTAEQRLDLLRRLERPDFKGLTGLIVSDLRERRGADFGSLEIHSKLTLAQLDELGRQQPELWRSERFVNAYTARLAPLNGFDLNKDPQERDAYYTRVWAAIEGLIPDFNSRKANLLYHWLNNDLKLGRIREENFMAYLKYPRIARYAPRLNAQQRRFAIDFSVRYAGGCLPPIENEEPLIRKILLRMLKDAPDYSEFAPYLKDEFLREVFAEAKATSGQGDPAQWVEWMDRSQYAALQQRVDIEFADENPVILAPLEPVVLSAYIKNVKVLIVKVYAVNTLNCYRETGKPIDLAMNLNGLTATYEQRHQYNEPEMMRVKREFRFPELSGRGVYIIELIGNGRSSRALVQRGDLKVVEGVTAGGHAFTVFDEENRALQGCVGWFNGAAYTAGDDGRIYLPFMDDDATESADDSGKGAAGERIDNIVVTYNGFAALKSFRQLTEKYALQGGFYVDREALMPGAQAEVVVRPRLTLNGRTVALELLNSPKLTITSINQDGVSSKSVVSDIKLTEEVDFTHALRVPERCVRLTLALEAKVENLASNREQDLKVSQHFDFNASKRDKSVNHLFLEHHSSGYTLAVRGRNGEKAANIPVNIYLKHRFFKQEIVAALKSDQDGVIQLGALRTIDSIRATWDGVRERQVRWLLRAPALSRASRVHGAVGETLRLPVPGVVEVDAGLSLLEYRGGVCVRDRGEAVTYADGYLTIIGLPAGDYELIVPQIGYRASVCVADAEKKSSYLLSDRRILERPKLVPLTIAAVDSVGGSLNIKLANASRYTRVHLVATRFLPDFDLLESLALDHYPLSSNSYQPPGCHYESGRDIGDEYRYILERQHAKKYPGNMLGRPGLLIAPWTKAETAAERELLAREGSFSTAGDQKARIASTHAKDGTLRGAGADRSNSVGSSDFLKESSVALYNLKPDQSGAIKVPLTALNGKPYLRIAAVDPETLIVREFSLPAHAFETRDLRLKQSLDAEAAFAEKRRTTVLKSNDVFEIRGAASAKFEIYDSVEKLYTLFTALNTSDTLLKFAFITRWNKLDIERKNALYSEFACHELNLFLYFKDPAFFKKVVRSFIANKRDKRFVDHWLLGDDLSDYSTGFMYSTLNAAERALLAQRIADKKALIVRDLREQVELQSVDQDRINHIFEIALQGGALDAGTEQAVMIAGALRGNLRNPQKERAKSLGSQGTMQAVKTVHSPVRSPGVTREAPVLPAANEMKKMDQIAKIESSLESEEIADVFSDGVAQRTFQRRLFQGLESTKERAENNYYELLIEQQDANLIKPNAFWQGYAEHAGERGFLSGEVARTANSLAEIMLAMAVMDLPFEAEEHAELRSDGAFELRAASPALVYHRQVLPGERAEQGEALVAQRFFRLDDRYRHVGNERYDKTVTAEFLRRVVYGAQVVLTNPTGGRLKLRLLLQIPQGSLPVLGGFYTRSFYVTLEPYATHQQEYCFYFPESGKYPHYPVTVANNEQIIGKAQPFVFNVVDQLSDVDRESWMWIAQKGTDADVLSYLQRSNIHRLDLDQIAWRMKEERCFVKVTDLLAQRNLYNQTLWSYSIYHNHAQRIAEYLEQSKLATASGLHIDAPILHIDPVERNLYEHLEYAPLVNPRAHRVGREHKIMNTRFRANYEQFMRVLIYKAHLSDAELLAVAWAMSLQDRIDEAINWFAKIDRKEIEEQIQYDYLDAYLAFYQSDVARAERIASGYTRYHVDRWRKKFENILAQVEEIQGESGLSAVDRRNRDQAQAALAATEPALEMQVAGGVIKVKGANIDHCELNFYPMDIELLFSRSPFVEAGGANFSWVRPALTRQIEIKSDNLWVETELPQQFATENVMIEASAAGARRTQIYYANTMDVRMVERYGQLSVRHALTGAPLPAVYVKVYALINGEVKFFKDGYTDLRGRFDYVSLNSNAIAQVDKLSVLIKSDTLGAVVREALPPAKAR